MQQAVFQIVNTEYELVENIKIDPEYSLLVPILSNEEYIRLKESIADVGLYEPIVINQDKVLLDGHHRLKIIKELKKEKIPVERKIFKNRLDEKIYVVSTNLARRHLFAAMRIKLSRDILEFETQKRAQENLERDRNKKGQFTPVSSPEEKGLIPVHTDKILAEKSGTSNATVYRARKVMDEGTQEEKQLMFSEEGKINTAYKKLVSRQDEEKPPVETPPVPEKKYRCIIIDPPWEMEKIERDERPNQGKHLDYASMTLEDIEKLPIKKLAFEEGCHIYLWTTHKHLPDAFDLFDSWGVKYQCLLTWVKPTGMTPFSWMYNTEHVLFGRIGSLQLQKLGIKLSFEESSREHSRKPDVFYDIVRQASPEPRLDMFSRERREGYDSWGNEVNKFNS